MEVRVGRLGGDNEVAQASSKQAEPSAGLSGAPLGLTVEALDTRTAAQLRVNGGVIVRAVAPDSAGSAAGLMPGDVIVQLGFQPISSLAEYENVIRQARSGERLPIRFFRNGNSVFKTIKVD